MDGVLVLAVFTLVFGGAWALFRRDVRRWEAIGAGDELERARGRAALAGAGVVAAAVAGPPLVALFALGAPAWALWLAALPLVPVAARANNAAAVRRPDLGLRPVRWSDELRTLHTPAGRVGVGLGVIVVVALALATQLD